MHRDCWWWCVLVMFRFSLAFLPQQTAVVRIIQSAMQSYRIHRRPPSALSVRSMSATPDAVVAWLEQHVQDTLHRLLLEQESNNTTTSLSPIVLAVSGGSDSTALLHLMASHEPQIVHFNHEQRMESAEEAQFVQQLCQSYRLNCTVYHWTRDYGSITTTPFSQASARVWRQERLAQHGRVIVTAHHLEDSYESMWLKLLRGSHITHLHGMTERMTDSNGTVWIRPLLQVSKQQLVDYLLFHKYEWREDESNQSHKYLRNRIRLQLVPLLQELVGKDALQQRMDNLAQQSSDLRLYMEQEARTVLSSYNSSDFKIPPQMTVVHQHALHLWMADRDVEVSYLTLQRVMAQLRNYPQNVRWKLNLGNHWNVVRVGHVLTLERDDEVADVVAPPVEVQVEWSFIGSAPPNQNDSNAIHLCVPTKHLENLVIRRGSARNDLLFTPPWRTRSLPVTEFLRGQKVPLDERLNSPVLLIDLQVVAAVYVSSKDKWIVGAPFVGPDPGGDKARWIEVQV